MAISNFIPTVWSENLLEALSNQYIAVSHCNREFEGDIKNKGSVVKICGVGHVNVSDYTKNTLMSEPQTLSDTVREFSIDQAKYFNFQIDDIDKAQCNPKLMDNAMRLAAASLSKAADQYVFSLASLAGSSVECDSQSADNIINAIIDARRTLYERNVSDQEEVVLEISPKVAAMILKAKIALPIADSAALENGYLGSLAGCKIYVSNNIKIHTDDLITNDHCCIMRTKRAIAFAEQLSEIDAYRPEKRFADAVKGLHLYGASVIYPAEMVLIKVKFPIAE